MTIKLCLFVSKQGAVRGQLYGFVYLALGALQAVLCEIVVA